jgi:hypothetical protein
VVEGVPEEATGFLEGIPLPAVVLDAGGAVVCLNSRFSGLLGGTPGEDSAAGGFSFVDSGDRDLVRSLLQEMAGDSSVTLTASLVRRDGEPARVLSFWSLSGTGTQPRYPRYLGLFVEMPTGSNPALGPAGSREGIVPEGTPMNKGSTPEGEPVPGRIDPGKRNQIIHTIIFHDAKNRLTALHGYADLLRESLVGSGFLAYIDKLEDIASEIERDLGVASMFSHLGLIAPRWQNLREVIARSASRESPGSILMDEIPGSLWCLADPLFPRVFSNLFENARRHGERVTAIRIAARETEAGLTISVEDNGIGIPADQKDRIFELGFGRHTGYGLYLAREVLSIAGFSIREAGDPGKGARFEIHVPRGRYMHRTSRPEGQDPVRIPAS